MIHFTQNRYTTIQNIMGISSQSGTKNTMRHSSRANANSANEIVPTSKNCIQPPREKTPIWDDQMGQNSTDLNFRRNGRNANGIQKCQLIRSIPPNVKNLEQNTSLERALVMPRTSKQHSQDRQNLEKPGSALNCLTKHTWPT